MNVGAQCLRPWGASIAPLHRPSFQLNGWMIYILQSPDPEAIACQVPPVNALTFKNKKYLNPRRGKASNSYDVFFDKFEGIL
ncbi:hypothetical protein Oscil6304_1775 [Oscillatoria acuminata PCC 6304]|uniref:Uncharacterized protein n=1 Tax=Oscillatoria acuminata PCC 6304 TaxID=56110 RepID=K9TGD5_9CYAN|nr:hypothetical protein Oscil6304_1775 [Oscillatoria acuminata PCC 6304]